MALCVGAWCNWLAEYKKNKEFEDSVQAAEMKVKDSQLEMEVHFFNETWCLLTSWQDWGLQGLGSLGKWEL